VKDPGIDGEIIPKWIFGEWVGWTVTRFIWLRIRAGGRIF
jgi:hypothetical protein